MGVERFVEKKNPIKQKQVGKSVASTASEQGDVCWFVNVVSSPPPPPPPSKARSCRAGTGGEPGGTDELKSTRLALKLAH